MGRGSSGVGRRRELWLGSAHGTGWVTAQVLGLNTVTGPAVPAHSDNDKRMPGARPGLLIQPTSVGRRHRPGVQRKAANREGTQQGRRSGGVLTMTIVRGDPLGGPPLQPVPDAGRSPPRGGHPHIEGRIKNRRSLANLLEPVYTKDRRRGKCLAAC